MVLKDVSVIVICFVEDFSNYQSHLNQVKHNINQYPVEQVEINYTWRLVVEPGYSQRYAQKQPVICVYEINKTFEGCLVGSVG